MEESHGQLGTLMLDAGAPPIRSTTARISVPWGLTEASGTFLISAAVYVFGAILLSVFLHSLYQRDQLAFGIVAYQFLVLGVIAGIALLIAPRYGLNRTTLGFLYPGWKKMLAAALSLLPILLGLLLLEGLFNRLLPGYHLQGNTRELLQGAPHPGPWESAILIIWASIEAPLAEETLFRGVIFQGLQRFFARWLPYHAAVFGGAAISGCVFGAAHLQPHTLPILIALGIALAYIFHYTRSLYGSALVHGINNFLAVITVLHGA